MSHATGGGLPALRAKKATAEALCGKKKTAVLIHTNMHTCTYSTCMQTHVVQECRKTITAQHKRTKTNSTSSVTLKMLD